MKRKGPLHFLKKRGYIRFYLDQNDKDLLVQTKYKYHDDEFKMRETTTSGSYTRNHVYLRIIGHVK
jgi:hypothetical protein